MIAGLDRRIISQATILAEFNARLAAKGAGPVSKGAFSRFSISHAIQTSGDRSPPTKKADPLNDRAIPLPEMERAELVAIVAEGVRAGLAAYDATKPPIVLSQLPAAADYGAAADAARRFRERRHENEQMGAFKTMLRFLSGRRGRSTSFQNAGAK